MTTENGQKKFNRRSAAAGIFGPTGLFIGLGVGFLILGLVMVPAKE